MLRLSVAAVLVMMGSRAALADHGHAGPNPALAQASAALASASASHSSSANSLASSAASVSQQLSQGSTYYYYYPVAAYPIHAGDNVHDRHSSSGGGGTSSYSNSGGLDKSPLVFLLVPLLLLLLAIPFLALIGVNVNGNGRGFEGIGRSSELDDKFGSFAELQTEIDLLLNKYIVALESDECMERIVCELGVKASGLPSKDLLFNVIEWLAPEHTILGKGRIGIMKKAATSNYSMETCKRYVCNPPAIVQQGITKDTVISKPKN